MMKKINKSDFISDFILNKNSTEDISLYIHVPFCESRCYYCDFYSSIINENNVNDYFENLYKELFLYKDFLKDKKIVSIFIGGGTPSSVNPKYIFKLMEKINLISTIEKSCEITIELNPNSVSSEKLKLYLNSKINRFSMGAQSFNDDILKKIGRIHKKEDIISACKLFGKYNIKNFNLDLMLALPSQKFEDIKESIKYIKLLDPAHISYYSLILETGTKLYDINQVNPLIFPDENQDRDMYHYIVHSLDDLGYKQYEISNFSKSEFESKHNLRYWKLKNYLGLGISSHSNINNLRFYNHNSFEKYYSIIKTSNLPVQDFEVLDNKDRINEFITMGLRLNSGINISSINKIFKIDFLNYYKNEISKNINLNLITIKNETIYLTELGRDLSNLVELDFIRL
uniref:radical SAM family heme chaperone HemW n=2 Tax=Peptoniphilus TaxID=162289 RepID=UPI001F33E356|nr:radical SAM family heme chaperone HemW [Peptoniphilus mikwangii]